MSSDLTIDIQLTELGFSSWDFQVLKQEETRQTSDLEHASSLSTTALSAMTSSCLPAEESVVDEESDRGRPSPAVSPASLLGDEGSWGHDSLVRVVSTERSSGESSKTVGEKERKRPRMDENADEQLEEDKKKKMHKDQRRKDELREESARGKLMGGGDGDDDDGGGDGGDDDGDGGDGDGGDGDDDGGGDDASVEEENEEDDEESGGLQDDEEDECDFSEAEQYDVLSSDTFSSEEHRCHLCNLTFPTTFLLHEHLHIHNGVRLYDCAECNKQFCHLVNYHKHLRSHAPAPPTKCIICTVQFPTAAALQQHLDTNHFEDQFFQCDLCKRIFTSIAECKKHVRTHRRRTKRHPCPECDRSFRHHSSMLYHLKRHSKDVFLCTDCGLAFSTKATLLRHSFHHLGVLPYTCIRCKRHFRLSSQYMKHECKPEQLQCVACLVVFKSQEDFLKHKNATGCWGHQKDLGAKANGIRCMECGQVFDSSEELKKHAGTHQRVMRCSECGMGFRSSIMLMSHMGGHAAERPCLCKDCGLGFCHQQTYDSHRKTCGTGIPEEIPAKKQKPDSKKEAVTSLKSKEGPVRVVSDQTKPADGLTTFSLNKEAFSPVPLVMLLHVPSPSVSNKNPEDLNANVATQVLNLPLPSDDGNVSKKSDKTIPLKDTASPVCGSNILIPLTSVENESNGWALLEDSSTFGSGTKTYTIIKETKQVADVELKPMLHIQQFNAQKEQKKVL